MDKDKESFKCQPLESFGRDLLQSLAQSFSLCCAAVGDLNMPEDGESEEVSGQEIADPKVPGTAEDEVEEGEENQEEDKEGDAKEGEDGKKKKKEKKEKKAKVVKDEKMGQVKDEDLDWIWIGGADDARDREALEKAKIRYVLNCTPVRSNGGVANFYEKDATMRMEYCRVSMGDNATETLQSRFEASWAFLEKARIREDGSVLIHCQQGVSRSVSMAMSYMMKYYRIGRSSLCPYSQSKVP
eukprot:s3830_g5.t1